jgi:DNA-binding NarL/FixJ family response regulator
VTGKQAKARIVVVDDHPMVRERLAEVINRERDLSVCGEAESASQALEVVATAQPDLAIVDLGLKDSQGLDLIKDLQVRHPKLAVLVVSMHEGSLYAERAMRAGARGYITKQEATKHILEAIRRVLAGELCISDALARQWASNAFTGSRAAGVNRLDCLADRELQVLELIGHGRGTRQIADALHLDTSTVETYRARIKEKLGLKDAAELLQHAIEWVHSSKP